MDTQEVAQQLTQKIKEIYPGIHRDYSMSFVEYMLCRELDALTQDHGANDNNQPTLFKSDVE